MTNGTLAALQVLVSMHSCAQPAPSRAKCAFLVALALKTRTSTIM